MYNITITLKERRFVHVRRYVRGFEAKRFFFFQVQLQDTTHLHQHTVYTDRNGKRVFHRSELMRVLSRITNLWLPVKQTKCSKTMVRCPHLLFGFETDHPQGVKTQAVRRSARIKAIRSRKRSIAKSTFVQAIKILPSTLRTSNSPVEGKVCSYILIRTQLYY